MDDALRISSVGLTLTASAVVLSGTPLPTNGNGEAARYTRLMCESGFAYAKIGTAAVSNTLVATLADILVTANESIILHTRGMTHISVVTRSGTAIMSAIAIEE